VASLLQKALLDSEGDRLLHQPSAARA
jgi:hypothetical protein